MDKMQKIRNFEKIGKIWNFEKIGGTDEVENYEI